MPEGPFREPLTPLPSDDEALARDVLLGAVEPGEQLVWAGRPLQGLRLALSDVIAIPFSLLWGGFAIFWEVTAIVGNAPFFFCLWGIPFVFVGLYLIVGRFLVDARRRARTFYGLTDARALIVVIGSTRKLTVLDLAGQKEIEMSEGAHSRGSIRFGPATMQSTFAPAGWPGANKNAPPTFESIPEVRAVYAQLRAGQRALGEAKPR